MLGLTVANGSVSAKRKKKNTALILFLNSQVIPSDNIDNRYLLLEHMHKHIDTIHVHTHRHSHTQTIETYTNNILSDSNTEQKQRKSYLFCEHRNSIKFCRRGKNVKNKLFFSTLRHRLCIVSIILNCLSSLWSIPDDFLFQIWGPNPGPCAC